jgi:hypothetical protein
MTLIFLGFFLDHIWCLYYSYPHFAEKLDKTVEIETKAIEIEEKGVKLRLTVVDTPGMNTFLFLNFTIFPSSTK